MKHVRFSVCAVLLVVLCATFNQAALADHAFESFSWMQEASGESPTPLIERVFGINADNPSNLVVFLGRFHPLIVHFPIAILLLAIAMEYVTRRKRFSDLRPAVSPLLFLGAVSAVFSVFAGLLLAATGGYAGDTIWWHKWLGIGVAVAAIAAYFIRKRAMVTEALNLKRAYSGLLLASLVLITVASHKGGALTHGEDYLTEYMPEPIRTWAGIPPRDTGDAQFAIENIDEAHVFDDLIQPILNARCTTCHNPNKIRGGLLLTTAEEVMEGGESGTIIEPSNSAQSDLFRRIALPSGDDDRMPPSGRRPLTDDQIELIGWWIDSGASAAATVAESNPPEEVSALLTRLTGTAEKGALDIVVEPANPEAIAALQEHGILVLPISSETNLLQVMFTNVKDSFTPENLSLLGPIGEQIAWLNLAGAPVSDAGLEVLTSMPNLSKLHLEKTDITDDGLAHIADLTYLEYLNLYNTSVSNDGLQHLQGLNELKKLFLWQTEVTPEGARGLAESLPDIDINLGWGVEIEEAGEQAPPATAD